jgi:hypothetical protein
MAAKRMVWGNSETAVEEEGRRKKREGEMLWEKRKGRVEVRGCKSSRRKSQFSTTRTYMAGLKNRVKSMTSW